MSNFNSIFFKDIGSFGEGGTYHFQHNLEITYVPLGGSKLSKWISIRNIFIIFIVAVFGMELLDTCLENTCYTLYPLVFTRKNRQYITSIFVEDKWLPSLNELFQMVGILYDDCWVFLEVKACKINLYLLNMVLKFDVPLNQRKGFVYVFVMIILDWIYKKNKNLNNVNNKNLNIVLLIIIGSIIFLFSNPIKQSDFIYFQF